MDYDFITTCNWTATGTYTLRAYRGSGTNVVTTHYASIHYRKKGTTTWSTLNSSGQISITSTGEWEIGNDWNKSGNHCLTHSYYGITAIDKCTKVEFDETSLGTNCGNFFLAQCWYGCTSLTSMSVGFNLPTGITTVGDNFLAQCWYGCTSLTSMPVGFNLPTGITTAAYSFIYETWKNCSKLTSMPDGFNFPTGMTTINDYSFQSCWENCYALTSMPSGFNIPSGVTSTYLCRWCWNNCTALDNDDYTEDITFRFYSTDAFGGTCPITPSTPAGTTTTPVNVAVNRIKAPTVTTQACTNITYNSVSGNGNITDAGSASPTTRGFCYIKASTGDPTTSDSKVSTTGTYSTGSFSISITSLDADSDYRVRAYATNSVGTSYGTTVGVTTKELFIKTISEAVKFDSSIVKTIGKNLIEVLKINEIYSKTKSLLRTLTETLKINDILSKLSTLFRAFTENIVVSSMASAIRIFLKILSETIKVGENFIKLLGKKFVEIIKATDSSVRFFISRTFKEIINTLDHIAKKLTIKRTLTEVIKITQDIGKTMYKIFVEIIGVIQVFGIFMEKVFAEVIKIASSSRKLLNGFLVGLWTKVARVSTGVWNKIKR